MNDPICTGLFDVSCDNFIFWTCTGNIDVTNESVVVYKKPLWPNGEGSYVTENILTETCAWEKGNESIMMFRFNLTSLINNLSVTNN